MVTVRGSLSESYLATPAVVGVIRQAVADFANANGVCGPKVDAVKLAVSEAVSNVVLHAYPEAPGEVHVTARALEGELWVIIDDDGRGHNNASERPGLGWGLALITDACDEFTLVERAQGGTEARMCFRIEASSTGPSVSEG